MRVHEMKAKLLDNGHEGLIKSWIPLVIKGGKAKQDDYALLLTTEDVIDHQHDPNCKTFLIIRKKKMNDKYLEMARKLGNLPVYFIRKDKLVKEYVRLLQSTDQKISFTHKRGDKGDSSFKQSVRNWWSNHKGENFIAMMLCVFFALMLLDYKKYLTCMSVSRYMYNHQPVQYNVIYCLNSCFKIHV